MDLVKKYITNITINDVKHACSYKVHASYVLLGIILTWFLSIMSSILTTLFLASVFIIIVNIAKKDSCSGDDDDIQLMLSKLDESSSSDESDNMSESNEPKPVNSLSESVLNDSNEVVVERDGETKKEN